MFLLALAVSPSALGANSSLLSAASGGTPAKADTTTSPLPHLELLGRWHGGPVYSSAVSGDHLYFGTGGGIRILRIKQASEQGTPSWKEVASITTAGVVRDLVASGKYLYVADASGALRIIDISTPEKPREVTHVKLPPNV